MMKIQEIIIPSDRLAVTIFVKVCSARHCNPMLGCATSFWLSGSIQTSLYQFAESNDMNWVSVNADVRKTSCRFNNPRRQLFAALAIVNSLEMRSCIMLTHTAVPLTWFQWTVKIAIWSRASFSLASYVRTVITFSVCWRKTFIDSSIGGVFEGLFEEPLVEHLRYLNTCTSFFLLNSFFYLLFIGLNNYIDNWETRDLN